VHILGAFYFTVTAFYGRYQPGVFPLPSAETSAMMYRLADTVLARGEEGEAGEDDAEGAHRLFEHYEVSNFARLARGSGSGSGSGVSGMRSRHNQKYWSCEGVFGFGIGAASFVDGVRVTRPATMRAYASFVEGLEDCEVEAAVAARSPNDVPGVRLPDLLEVVMLALRTR
jgi:oxygen-independent coproporphyrinogen-3 oxidase